MAPLDKLHLHGMVFFGHHGQRDEEASLGQRFEVDLDLTADLEVPGRSDQLADTVDYVGVYHAVKAVVEGPRRRLLEALATDISDRVLAFPGVDAVMVRIRKPSAPLPGAVDYAGVEITRSRT
ncbi:MAG: dihydroneopterin aldolase [Chloroflexota bacterium]